ncbi:hypothetical protein HDE77_002845 [Rhodanobacter sp. MP7CTX1]|nr:hypothetical protein [Rhodanobacter sp. MP7CTX1]
MNNPHRKRWGFFFGCCCRDRRSRAATGHRQGLYPETPSPETVGVFLWLLLPRSQIASCNRSPPGALSKKASPIGEAFVFVRCCCCCDRRSRAGTGHRQGPVLNNPHRKRWGFFLGRLPNNGCGCRLRSSPCLRGEAGRGGSAGCCSSRALPHPSPPRANSDASFWPRKAGNSTFCFGHTKDEPKDGNGSRRRRFFEFISKERALPSLPTPVALTQPRLSRFHL